ncbi:MAG: FAD:protein FMN transferase [Gemmatimonadaceae bacterium]
MIRLLERAIGNQARGWVQRRRRTRVYTFHYERVLGTSLELQVVAAGGGCARRAESAVLAEIDRLEQILSGWAPNSELALWLATSETDVPVSADLADVLHASAVWRERTGGAFNPAAQAIVERLRDGASAGAEPSAHLGPLWRVDRASGTARRLTQHSVSLDAIAKGYIVARAAARVRAVDGVSDVLLNIGGDLQHFGRGTIAAGVADPLAPAENAPPIAAVRLRNAALATSGGYRRGFLLGGRRVSHIVDPRIGQPADRIASASVFAPDCATADALSTAFSVMLPHESVALADSLGGVGCLLVERDGTITTNVTWNERAVATHNDESTQDMIR